MQRLEFIHSRMPGSDEEKQMEQIAQKEAKSVDDAATECTQQYAQAIAAILSQEEQLQARGNVSMQDGKSQRQMGLDLHGQGTARLRMAFMAPPGSNEQLSAIANGRANQAAGSDQMKKASDSFEQAKESYDQCEKTGQEAMALVEALSKQADQVATGCRASEPEKSKPFSDSLESRAIQMEDVGETFRADIQGVKKACETNGKTAEEVKQENDGDREAAGGNEQGTDTAKASTKTINKGADSAKTQADKSKAVASNPAEKVLPKTVFDRELESNFNSNGKNGYKNAWEKPAAQKSFDNQMNSTVKQFERGVQQFQKDPMGSLQSAGQNIGNSFSQFGNGVGKFFFGPQYGQNPSGSPSSSGASASRRLAGDTYAGEAPGTSIQLDPTQARKDAEATKRSDALKSVKALTGE